MSVLPAPTGEVRRISQRPSRDEFAAQGGEVRGVGGSLADEAGEGGGGHIHGGGRAEGQEVVGERREGAGAGAATHDDQASAGRDPVAQCGQL